MKPIRSQPASSSAPSPGQREEPSDAVERFARSMILDQEKWRDGIGYDLQILERASPEERVRIEQLLIAHRPRDWRDIEALAVLQTDAARWGLREALKDPDPQVRLAVTRYAADLVKESERTASLVQALESAEFFGGLSQALDEAAEFHPPEVVQALLRGVVERDGEIAVHFAALLAYIHGRAAEPFDMAQRPFFLRFNTPDRAARSAAYQELCRLLGVAQESLGSPDPSVFR